MNTEKLNTIIKSQPLTKNKIYVCSADQFYNNIKSNEYQLFIVNTQNSGEPGAHCFFLFFYQKYLRSIMNFMIVMGICHNIIINTY